MLKNQLNNSTNKISTRLLGLEFKSGNIIKSKTMKHIAKEYCLIISYNGNLLCQS